jgi:uncharacterized protein
MHIFGDQNLNLQRRNFTWSKLPLADEPAGQFTYLWSADKVKKVFKDSFYQELINTSTFRRLADIRFLGAIDYFIHPTGKRLSQRRHTRLEHTLGVGHLALRYSRLAELPESQERLVVAAALLHDIGHPPLSHSIEGAFKRHFKIDHHLASSQIIQGTAPYRLGEEIPKILSGAKIDSMEVISLMGGRLRDSQHNFIFAHPINVDTIEAISRSETYLKPQLTSPTPDAVLDALLTGSHLERVDEFWALKDRIYRFLIQGPLGIYADNVALGYVEALIATFSPDDFFLSESKFRNEHPSMFARMTDARRGLVNGRSTLTDPIEVTTSLRRFFIDESYPIGSPERYKQSKTKTAFENNL